jgi:hypothetical protein
VITRLRKQLPDDAKPDEIELEFKKFCKTAKGKDEKFVSLFFIFDPTVQILNICYHIN